MTWLSILSLYCLPATYLLASDIGPNRSSYPNRLTIANRNDLRTAETLTWASNDLRTGQRDNLGQLDRYDTPKPHPTWNSQSRDFPHPPSESFADAPYYETPSPECLGPSPDAANEHFDAPFSIADQADSGPRSSLAQLLRPSISIQFDRLAESSQIGVDAYGIAAKMPLYPVFGPPPPFIELGYRQIRIGAPADLDLPDVLHESVLGLSWMRPLSERWMLALGSTAALASDGHAVSSDAWQFRGNLFAIYRRTDTVSFAFGAIATGRSDLPVIPVAGVIWLPTDDVRCDLRLPQARFARRFVITDSGRSHWAYLGAGFWGGTWAFENNARIDDRITYRDWRVNLGWELVRPQSGPAFIPPRKIIGAEFGYAFARKFEFDSFRDEITPTGTFFLQFSATY